MQAVPGFAALALVGLWIAYLVPHKLRHRQQLLESRTDDRFSGALRVLAVTDPQDRARAAEDRPECGPASEKRSGLLTPGRGIPVREQPALAPTGGRAVDRPHGTQDRITADAARRTAHRRAAHAAAVARRGAAARRRGMLTAVLLVATVAGWGVFGLTSVGIVAGIAPTVVLASVLVAGRRAVLAGQASDRAWQQEMRESRLAPARPTQHAPAVTGRAVRPSEASTEIMARITDEILVEEEDVRTAPVRHTSRTVRKVTASSEVGVTEAESDDAEGWSPVPVPRPTYTFKAAAPRREPVPLDMDSPVAEAADVDVVPGADETAAPAAETVEAPAGAGRVEPTTTGGLDLDAILARRRASGE